VTQASVGRIVHYVSHGTPIREDGTQAFPCKCRAAIITDVCETHDSSTPGIYTPCMSLCVLNPTGQFFNEHVKYWHADNALKLIGGTWHWPELVN
jgi:hypothetical protein